MVKEQLSAVIVGAGFMGKTHLECYLNIDSVTLAGVVDQDKSRGEILAALGDCPWFDSLDSCFASIKPDFVDVCLPSNLHRAAVIRALENGCDVIVEKPFAVELEDIDAMIEAEQQSKRRLMVAHTCRFMPQYMYAKNIILSGELGKPLAVSFCRESETPAWSWNNWLQNKKASGGTILDLSIHDIDLANWFLGVPDSFHAYETRSGKRPGAGRVRSLLSYPSQACADISANHLMPKGYPLTASYRIVFEDGVLEWNTVNCKPGCIFRYTDGKRMDIPGADAFPGLREDPYETELAAFADCLINLRPFPISVQEARLAVSTVKELSSSMESRDVH